MKVLIAIKGCKGHENRWKAQWETWVQKSNAHIQFFTGEMLDVPDDYEHLPHKTQAICKWALWNKFGHTFLCDTDTYVHLPRLLASIDNYRHSDYVGHAIDPGRYASGGAGYWLSPLAQRFIANADVSGFTEEDRMVGLILTERQNLRLHHDPRYTLALDSWPEPGNDIITKHLSMNGPYEVSMMYAAHKRAHP